MKNQLFYFIKIVYFTSHKLNFINSTFVLIMTMKSLSSMCIDEILVPTHFTYITIHLRSAISYSKSSFTNDTGIVASDIDQKHHHCEIPRSPIYLIGFLSKEKNH